MDMMACANLIQCVPCIKSYELLIATFCVPCVLTSQECVLWFEALEITADNTLKKTMLLLINNHRLSAGSYNSSWSCYFFPETSQECRDRAFELLGNKEALERGIITTKDSYKSKEIWTGRTPRQVIIACVIRISPWR
jgi:hypothetical protein